MDLSRGKSKKKRCCSKKQSSARNRYPNANAKYDFKLKCQCQFMKISFNHNTINSNNSNPNKPYNQFQGFHHFKTTTNVSVYCQMKCIFLTLHIFESLQMKNLTTKSNPHLKTKITRKTKPNPHLKPEPRHKREQLNR